MGCHLCSQYWGGVVGVVRKRLYQLCSSTLNQTTVSFGNVKQRQAFELTDAIKTPLCIFSICITPYVQVLPMPLMSSSANYLQTLQRGGRGPLEIDHYMRVRVGVLMKPSLSIASQLPTLALLVGNILPYRRRAINTCQRT
jgi:hypothetical protein